MNIMWSPDCDTLPIFNLPGWVCLSLCLWPGNANAALPDSRGPQPILHMGRTSQITSSQSVKFRHPAQVVGMLPKTSHCNTVTVTLAAMLNDALTLNLLNG